MKIAVVGSGISGLSAAYYLSKKHKVDLFEKENQFGGHANTLNVKYDLNKEINVDIGFMVLIGGTIVIIAVLLQFYTSIKNENQTILNK